MNQANNQQTTTQSTQVKATQTTKQGSQVKNQGSNNKCGAGCDVNSYYHREIATAYGGVPPVYEPLDW
jgi:hypothetical protein